MLHCSNDIVNLISELYLWILSYLNTFVSKVSQKCSDKWSPLRSIIQSYSNKTYIYSNRMHTDDKSTLIEQSLN